MGGKSARNAPRLPASGPAALYRRRPWASTGQTRCRHCVQALPSVADVGPTPAPRSPNARVAVVVVSVSVRQTGADKREPVADEPAPEVESIPERKSTAAQPHGMDSSEVLEAAGTTQGSNSKPAGATKSDVSHAPESHAAMSHAAAASATATMH